MALIEVDRLVKVYSGDVLAVDGVGFHVDEGEIFGFLGPNGAGKTTTIRVLVTLLRPTSGTAVIDGLDVVESPEAVRSRVGYAAQFIGVDDDLTARENLVLQARLHGLSRHDAHARTSTLLEVLQLTDVAERRAGTFSGGMRRRLDLGQALAHDPRLLFLDEPTTGLDPQNRRALWGYLRELNERGVTIFLTTQYLEEADELAHRIAIIDHGRLAIEGTPHALKTELGSEAVTVTLPSDLDDDLDAAVFDRLASLVPDGAAQREGVEVKLFAPADRLIDVVRALDGMNVHPQRLEVSEPTLDDVFLRHTGEKLRVDEVKPKSRMPLRSRRR